MQQLFRMRDAEGNNYEVPASDMGEFSAAVKDAGRVTRFRDGEGNEYDVPDGDFGEFKGAVPDAAPVRQLRFANGSTRSFTGTELRNFLRGEYRTSDEFKADRDEVAAKVRERVGEVEPRQPAENAEAINEGIAGGKYVAKRFGSGLSRIFTGALRLADSAARAFGTKTFFDNREIADTIEKKLAPTKEETEAVDPVVHGIGAVAETAGSMITWDKAFKGLGFWGGNTLMSAEAGNDAYLKTYDVAIASGKTPEEANEVAVKQGVAATATTAAYGLAVKTLGGLFNGKTTVGAEDFAGEAMPDFNSLVRAVQKGELVKFFKNGLAASAGAGAASGAGEYFSTVYGKEAMGNKADWSDPEAWWNAAEGFATSFGLTAALSASSYKQYRSNVYKAVAAQAKEAASTPETRAMWRELFPEGSRNVILKRLQKQDISRTDIAKAGYPEMSQAERNAIGDAMTRDYIDAVKAAKANAPKQIGGAPAPVEQPKAAETTAIVPSTEAKAAETPTEPIVEPPQTRPAAETGNEPSKPAEGVETPSRASGEEYVPEAGRDDLKVQGTDYTVGKAKELLREDVAAKIAEAAEELGVDLKVKGVELHGSRVRGDAKKDSDLDLVVEYEGDAREDTLWEILNEKPTVFGGIKVDINPINAEKSGTLSEYMKRSAEYDAEKMARPKPDGKGKMVKVEPKENTVETRGSFIEEIERDADKKVALNEEAGVSGENGQKEPLDEATKRELKEHYMFQAFEEGISDSDKLSSKEGVGEVFDTFKNLVEKYNPPRDENGTVISQSVRRAAWMIESSTFATPEQKAFAHKYGEKYGTAADKPKPDGKGKMVKPAPTEGKKPKQPKANVKKAAKIVEDFVAKDTTRPSLTKPFYDKKHGVVVATDGRVLIATKHGYDENADNGNFDYPNWPQVVPAYKDGEVYKHTDRTVDGKGKFKTTTTDVPVHSVKLDPSSVAETCKKAIRLRNTLQNRKSDTAFVAIELPGGEAVMMDAEYMLKVAKAMEANGITEIKAISGRAPILAKNADTTIVAMPMRAGDQTNIMKNISVGREGTKIIFDAATGRLVSAPKRNESTFNTREYADSLRKSIEKDRANSLEWARKTNLYSAVLKAWESGETDARKVYESVAHETWDKLSPENRARFEDWMKAGDKDALAQKIADYEAERNPITRKGRNEDIRKLEKIEKILAAEDEIDALIKANETPPPSKGEPKESLGAPSKVAASVMVVDAKETKLALEKAVESDKASGMELSSIVRLSSAIGSKDTATISELAGRHFKFAKTSSTLKGCGLTGDHFSIRAGVILRHNGKDASHTITPSEWVDLADALATRKPELVEKYGKRDGQYRIWTQATINGRNAIVGAEVKNVGKEIEINAIQTVFGADGARPKRENVVYPKTEEEMQSVLTRHNSGRYTESPQPIKSVPKPSAPVKGGGKPTVGDEIAELDKLIAEEEAGGGVSGGGAEGLPSNSPNFQPGPGVKGLMPRLVSKNSIIRAIKDNFPEFAIRDRNTTRIGKNYAGHFEPWRELIRSKDMSSMDTVAHEVGHGISMLAKRKFMNIPQEAKRELAKFGRDLYGTLKPAAGYMEEGFAEFVRGYMTGAEDLAQQAPSLTKWFETSFAKAHPDYVRRMDNVRREVMRWRMQSDIQKVAAMQKPETSAVRRAWDKVKSVFTQEAWNDEGATLTKGYKASGLDTLHEWRADFRQLEAMVKAGKGGTPEAKALADTINKKILTDPRIFASNARGTSKARVLDMAKYGVTNLTGTEKIGNVTGFDAKGRPIRDNVTESYRDIFGDFTKKELADFDVYASAKVGLENYVKKGKEFGMDQATLERVVQKLESPKFLNALERFTAFSRRALSVGLEAGALTPEQYKKIVGEHKYYVRTERRIAEDGAGTGGSQQSPIKKIKGSTKNIVPPRTATLMQIEKQLRYFQTMKVLNMVARDIRIAEAANTAYFKKGEGREYKIGANLPVKVPNAVEGVKFKAEKLRDQTTAAMISAGTAEDKAAANELFDQLFADGDTQLTVFRERPSGGRHGLVSTYIDGNLVTFELPDAAWEKYITGMERGEGGFGNKVGDTLWSAVTAPTKVLRLGATTLNPVFASANFMRDAFHAAIMSESGSKPLVSSVAGMMNDILGKDASRLFRSMGGEMAMLMGSGPEAQMKHASESALAKGFLGEVAANTSLTSPLSGITRTIADILSKPEMGPRVREVMGVMKKAQAAGLSREAAAWLAFAGGKDISIDFGKHGFLMKRLNQLIPYTNAWYRGLEQFGRKFGITSALPTQFEERRGVSAAKTGAKALGWLTVSAVAASIAKMLTMDEDERRAQFKKTPREKWDYDEVLGVRVPLPFELGNVFYSIPKAIVYEAFGDKGAVKEAIWHALSSNIGKYSSVQDFLSGITAIAPFVDNLRNEKWDGAPIVAPHIKDAYARDKQMWYDHSTTDVAKWVGEKLDWAPAHIDHVANTWTGGMWNRILSPAADNSFMTLSGLATFRPRPTARRDVREFYDFRSEVQSHYNAGNAPIEDVGRLRRANKLHEELSPLFKEARELSSSGMSSDERRTRREAIMNEVFDKIHQWNVADVDDRKGGVAKAVDALTASAEPSDDVRAKSLAALDGISYEEAAAAIKAYAREKVYTPVRNSRGFKTGKMKASRRWSDETLRTRLWRLRRAMEDR